MESKQAFELLEKYKSGTISAEERLLLESWYNERAKSGKATITDIELEEELDLIWARLDNETRVANRTVKLWPRIAAAAAVFLVIGVGLLFYTSYYAPRHPDTEMNSAQAGLNDIKPGSNKAYLILSNGKRLSLTDAANGAIAKEAGVEITKTADGQVVYKTQASPLSPQGGSLPGGARGREENTIETPKGGQYQIRLPDGSQVWLNAASKLIYPVTFNGRGQREVFLSGEAYFEIAKDKQHPFQVKSAGQVVTVLGTHFNISNYSDEATTKTTLLEGSVRISMPSPSSSSSSLRGGTTKQPHTNKEVASSLRFPTNDDGDDGSGVVLKPNEQAILKNNKINILPIDAQTEIAWKNGKFVFNSESIASIMRKVSRWYDVEVSFEGDLGNQTFTGSVNRFDDVSKLLRKIEMTNTLHFKIEGRRIAVTR